MQFTPNLLLGFNTTHLLAKLYNQCLLISVV